MAALAYHDALGMALRGILVGLVPIERTDGGTTVYVAGFAFEPWMAARPPALVALMTLLNTRRSAEEAGCRLAA